MLVFIASSEAERRSQENHLPQKWGPRKCGPQPPKGRKEREGDEAKQRDHTTGRLSAQKVVGPKEGGGEEWGRPQAAPTVPQRVAPPPVWRDRRYTYKI